jgi:pectate disaccharide-lyase
MTTSAATTTLDAAIPVLQTFFVAPSGDDKDDGSFERPFATIQRAIEKAWVGMGGGNQIFLRAGTYAPTKTLKLSEHGSPQRWSRLAAWRNEHVVIEGSKLAPDQPLIKIKGSYYEISGLELAGATKSAISLYGPHVRLIRNVIRDSVWGRSGPSPARRRRWCSPRTSSTTTA